jgi:hypothetical protein
MQPNFDFNHEFYQIDEIKFANSYSRMGAVLNVFDEFPDRRTECFALLGSEWSACDNIASHARELRALLRRARREELNQMMDASERAVWDSLPETLTVYRGCYAFNKKGLSWTLDRNTAERFLSLIRYWQSHQPLLLTGVAKKSIAVYKADRNEQEIIAYGVKVLDEQRIAHTNPFSEVTHAAA